MELLIEIGCEELPASFQRPSVEWMRDRLGQELGDARLWSQTDAPPIATFATPRRLAVIARGIAERAPDAKKVLLGPPLKTAYGADGKPTQAAVGFAKKAGVPVETLRPDGDRVAVVQDLKGQTALEALPGIVDRLVAQLPFRKAMRWGAESAPFARPVHWIAASLDGVRVAARYADVTSGLASRGHRFHAPAEFPLPSADGYVAALRERHVLVDWAERRARVWAEVQRAAAEAGGQARALRRSRSRMTSCSRPSPASSKSPTPSSAASRPTSSSCRRRCSSPRCGDTRSTSPCATRRRRSSCPPSWR